jgi:hypothetical protein
LHPNSDTMVTRMTPSKHAGQALADALLSPAASFSALRDRRSWAWLALAVLVASQALGIYAFYGPMSPEWIVQQQLAAADVQPAQVEDARGALMHMAPHTAHLGAVTGTIMLALVAALLGLAYFLGERALTAGRNSYGGWFAVALWSMLPMALNSLGLAALSLTASNPDQPLRLANYASLNNLVLGLPTTHGAYLWAESLNLFHPWSVALAAVAFRVWSAATWPRALLLAALPYLLLFGIWGALT